ncbi:hypothetical protein EsDP_00004076 [Epichloe bromicola]|uniref:Cell wall galactomannoprotein n=1 Tax=Epichloe bromicola TaxID=79588 RepID=A0ABQ0CQN4_9HYPO
MLLLSTLMVPLLAVVAAASPLRRDGNGINAALAKISKQLVEMDETLGTFNRGLAGTVIALKIQGQATALQKGIESATSTTKKSAELDKEESTSVAFSVNSLTKNIYRVLDRLVEKKPDFDKAIFGVGSASGLVKQDLQNLQKATGDFGAALTDKFVGDVRSVSPLVVSAINHHFEEALKVYA